MVRVIIEGVDEMDLNLKRMGLAIPKTVKQALQQSGVIVEGMAKRIVPVKSGTLRKSINSKVKKNMALIGTNVNYAPFIELGTSRMRAQPYLRPALKRSRKAIENIFSLLWKKEVEGRIR